MAAFYARPKPLNCLKLVPALNNSNGKKFFLISRFDLFISKLNGDEFILMIWTFGCGGVISVKGKKCQELILFFDNNTVTTIDK